MAVRSNYTYFGDVVSRIFRRHGFTQAKFAREAEENGMRYNSKGMSGRYVQHGLSQWMAGKHAAPRQFPSDLRKLIPLEPDEWLELAVAFAYGQDMSREDFEDLEEFWSFYRMVIETEAEEQAGGQNHGQYGGSEARRK